VYVYHHGVPPWATCQLWCMLNTKLLRGGHHGRRRIGGIATQCETVAGRVVKGGCGCGSGFDRVPAEVRERRSAVALATPPARTFEGSRRSVRRPYASRGLLD